MAISIQISESDIKPLIEFYEGKLSTKDREIQVLQKERDGIVSLINELNAKLDNKNGSEVAKPLTGQQVINKANQVFDDGYKIVWTWEDKAKFALSKTGRPMSTGEIALFLERYEPGIREKRRNLSSILSDKSKEGKVFFIAQTSEQGYPKYALKEAQIKEFA